MRKWFTLSFLSLAFFFYMSDRALFGLLVIPIQKTTGLTDVQVGLVDTALFWVYALLVPFAGFLGDRFDRRKVIAAAILLWGAVRPAGQEEHALGHAGVLRQPGRGVPSSGMDSGAVISA